MEEISTRELSPKQLETVEVIYQLSSKFNYPPTLDEIAAAMGITKGTLQYHMMALRKKRAVTWNTGSARSLQISDSDLIDHCRSKYPDLGLKSNPAAAYRPEFDSTLERTQIPILGKIAAGAPLTVMDKTDEYLELDTYFPTGCYALRVKGESMIDALISDGDLVLVEPRSNAHNGEIVVALINNEGATLKRFYKEDGRVRLQPENPTMEPIYIDPKHEDLKIQGVVKGVIRKT